MPWKMMVFRFKLQFTVQRDNILTQMYNFISRIRPRILIKLWARRTLVSLSLFSTSSDRSTS